MNQKFLQGQHVRRGIGEFGQGREHHSKGRSPDPGGKNPETCRVIDAKPQTFTDLLRRRQSDTFSDNVVQEWD